MTTESKPRYEFTGKVSMNMTSSAGTSRITQPVPIRVVAETFTEASDKVKVAMGKIDHPSKFWNFTLDEVVELS